MIIKDIILTDEVAGADTSKLCAKKADTEKRHDEIQKQADKRIKEREQQQKKQERVKREREQVNRAASKLTQQRQQLNRATRSI